MWSAIIAVPTRRKNSATRTSSIGLMGTNKPTPMASSTIVTSLPKRADTPSGTLTGRLRAPRRGWDAGPAYRCCRGEDRRGDDLLLPPEGGKGGRVLWLQANVDFDYKAKP